MDKLNKILREVLKEITPTPEEREKFEKVIKEVLEVADSLIKPLGLDKTLAGSFIRDTWMPDKKEFEIFILFPEDYSREKLEETGLEIGKKIIEKLKGEYRIAYAEHPYVRGKIKGFEVDIVPCYKVKCASKIKSAVDRTPFHNEFILKNLKKEMASEVRLLKQFCKGIGIYGSDVKTQGFSGYLCELLIIKYKTFKNLFSEASKWSPGEIWIDFKKHEKTERLKRKFRSQPLVFIDPVDPNRNVASALSSENFIKFVKACKEFKEKPSKDFFFPKKEKVNFKEIEKLIKKRGTRILGIKFKHPDVVPDIFWSQFRKTAKRIKGILEEDEFKVLNYGCYSNERDLCIILFEMEVWELPEIKKLIGPIVFSKLHVKQFISKYKGLGRIWVEGNYWVGEIKRKYKKPKEKLTHSLSDSYEELKAKGIASHIAESISKGFKILEDKEIIELSKKNQDFALFLKEFFEKNMV